MKARLNMHNKISDLVTGKACEGFYLLSAMSLKKTTAGKTYLAGEIADATGSIPVVLWDYAGELNAEDVGAVIKVRGDVSEYREKKQVTLHRVRRATDDDPYDLSELVPCAPIDVEREMEYVDNLIDSMKDQDYLRFAKAALKRNEKMFRLLPAAKGVHHAFVSGLLMHTVCMLKQADSLCEIYGTRYINRDLLLAGVLVHDFAKGKEFEVSPIGMVKDYTEEGNLLGHTVMGMMEIERIADLVMLPKEKKLLLQHMIAAHHGKPEFGAAAVPQIVEAEMLHYIDMIDSRFEIYREAMEETPKGEFSDRIFALEHRVYNHGV